jgi:3-hydroxyacyl-CoA dehydrogenase
LCLDVFTSVKQCIRALTHTATLHPTPQDLKVKHKVLAEMEEILPKHAIFASNTSAIPIADIAKGAKR